MISFNSLIRRLVQLLIVLSLFGGDALQAHAQIDPERLKVLQERYNWGSIYLSYGVIPDIIQVLDNKIRLQKIQAAYQSSPPQSMVAFLSRYKSASVRGSIMLLQINFSAREPVAGYLTSADLNGTINRAPMSSQEVLAAANWIDLYLTNGNQVAQIFKILQDSTTTLPQAWEAIKKLNDNVFVSEDRIATLLISFRQMQKSKSSELESLKSTDANLYKTLQLFSSQFDTTITSFFQEFVNAQKDPWKLPHPDEIPNKDRQDEIAMLFKHDSWAGLTGSYSGPVAWIADNMTVYEDKLKLKLYQDYQQLLELEAKEQKPAPTRP